jgi:hypothetical protein
MELNLELTQIWHNATIASGCLADAIIAQKRNPGKAIRPDLAEAVKLLEKASIQAKQLLSSRDLR